MTVLFPTHNRLEYNQLTLPVILQAAKGRKVLIVDDMSTDGTWEWLNEIFLPDNVELLQNKSGNSTSQWALGLQDSLVANFCNDVLIHPDSLDHIEEQLSRFPNILGISPCRGDAPSIGEEHLEERTFNGCGVYRTAMFAEYGPVQASSLKGEERYFGFTSYQERICRELGRPCFFRDTGHIMTELDFTPLSRVKEYTSKGYSRDLT